MRMCMCTCTCMCSAASAVHAAQPHPSQPRYMRAPLAYVRTCVRPCRRLWRERENAAGREIWKGGLQSPQGTEKGGWSVKERDLGYGDQLSPQGPERLERDRERRAAESPGDSTARLSHFLGLAMATLAAHNTCTHAQPRPRAPYRGALLPPEVKYFR